MNSNLWKSPYLSCLPLALIPSDWEVQLLCISPGRWLHATALIRAGTIDPVFPRYRRDCRVADSGYYAWAVEPCSQPSAGFSVPKCWAFCASSEVHPVYEADGERMRGRMLGAGCCSQDTLQLVGNTPDSPQEQGRLWETTPVGHNLPPSCCPSFSATYHINEIMEGIKTLHFHFIL